MAVFQGITQRRLMTLANELETDGRIAPQRGPRIKLGARLVREWHGRTYTVYVTEIGFEFKEKSSRFLTKIARDITGAHWSGPAIGPSTHRINRASL